jgi:hypothetical protein
MMAFTPQLRRIMRLNFLGLCRAACLISTRSVGDDGDSLRLTTHSATRHERLTFQAELRRYAHPVSTSLAKCLCLRRSGRIARVKTQFGRLNTLKINSLLKFVRRTIIFVLLNMRISPWALPPLTWTAGKPAVFFYFSFLQQGGAFAPALSRSVAIMQQQVELMRLHSFCHNSADCPGDGAPTPPWRFPP